MSGPPASGLRLRRTRDDVVICRRLVLGESFLQRFLGLMGRSSLPEGEGLYLPTSSIHMMFMRFPIDAVFVAAAGADGARSVVSVRDHLPPWRGLVLPVRGARGVVELPAGTLGHYDVRPGDAFVFEADDAVKAGVTST